VGEFHPGALIGFFKIKIKLLKYASRKTGFCDWTRHLLLPVLAEGLRGQ